MATAIEASIDSKIIQTQFTLQQNLDKMWRCRVASQQKATGNDLAKSSTVFNM